MSAEPPRLNKDPLRVQKRSSDVPWLHRWIAGVMILSIGMGICAVSLRLLSSDQGLATEIGKVLPFAFLLLVSLAAFYLPGWGMFVLLGMELVLAIAAWPLFGLGVWPAQVAVLMMTLVAIAIAGWREATDRQRISARSEGLQAGAERARRDEGSLSREQSAGASTLPTVPAPERRASELQVLGDAAEVLGTRDVGAGIPQLLCLVWERLQLSSAVFLVGKEPGELAWHASGGELAEEMFQEGYKVPVGPETLVGWCAAHASTRAVQDANNPAVAFDRAVAGVQSEAVVPLVSRGDLIGVWDLFSTQAGFFDESQLAFIEGIAALMALAVTAQRSAEEATQTRQDLQELRRRSMHEAWEPFTPAASGYRWRRGDLSLLGHQPIPEVVQTFVEGRTVLHPGGELVAPISFGGQVLGALGLSDPDRVRHWTRNEIDLVESVAAQMGMVIQNVRLIDEARSSLEQITALHKRYLGEEWQRFMPGRDRAEFTFAQPGVPHRVPLAQELEQVLKSNEPLVVAGNGRGRQQSLLLAPIVLREHVYGALGLEEVQGDHEWTEDELAIVDAVTDQVAMAIENARLFTETEQRAIELERTAEQLREIDKFRAQFLATMSHELRTPLNSIIGFSRVILKGIDGPLSDLQRTDLEAIYSNGQHLLQMINDILDMSKIDAGAMELIIESVDLGAIIKGVVSASAVLVKEKMIELHTQVESGLPLVQADGARVRQIITNLMSNAVKFTDEGSITLRAWQQGDRVYVSVADTGIGIPQDKIGLVFDAFRQVDSSSTRRAQGTGLGLPISKHFVEMHGGELTAESQEGVGSTFTLWLPIEGPMEDIPALAGLEIDRRKRLILAIERGEAELGAYRSGLDANGYQVIGLYDAREAVRWSRYLKPWAVIIDVQLGDNLGWETLDVLHSTRATRQVPVIVCSALQEGALAISMGAGAYLPKPVVINDLLETLDRLHQ